MNRLAALGTGRNARFWILGLLLTAVAASLAAPQAWARPGQSRQQDRYITLLVSSSMDRKHLSGLGVNDKTSERALTIFLETLDPFKLYLTQADVDQFAAERTKIDDQIRSGDVSVANRIFDVFLKRVTQRTARAHEWVDFPHDFTIDESMVRDPEKLDWVKTDAEADERWRQRVKFDLLLQTTDKPNPRKTKPRQGEGAPEEQTPGAEQEPKTITEAEARDRLHKRYRSIAKRWEQTDNDELLEMFLTAVTTSFDPHSSYMSPSNLDNFMIMMRLELDGIGASLESKYGETIVRSLVPGGAADKDGRLQIDDVITGVGQGTDGQLVDITDMKLNDVVMMIRGKPDSIVRLEVKTAATSELKTYDIKRARIELKDSEARSRIIERGPDGAVIAQPGDEIADSNKRPTAQIIGQERADGSVIKIGVIDLPSFYMDMDGRRDGKDDYKSTARDMERLLREFKEQGVDLVIVDLRFNGGGSLPESVDATGLFIDKGPVVQVKGTDGRIVPYRDDKSGALWSGPLVVVINKFSASASEIFAGAIQDYARGIVVGDRATHGKGTVQQLDELGRVVAPLNPPNYGALKMTIQQFYRPGGDSTQNRGVVSDVELPSRTTHWDVGESDLKYAMKFDRVNPLPHDNYRFATPQIIQQLKIRSEARVTASEHFQKEKKAIERYLARKEDPSVTLNREKFLAEVEELNTEKDQEKVFDEIQAKERKIFPETPYNEEVLAIAVDYLQLLNEQRLAQK